MTQVRRLALLVLLVVLALPAAALARSHAFGTRVLHKGSTGTDVKTLQDLLNQAGYRTAVDGEFGAGTARSVRSWEAADSRKVDGRVSKSDAHALQADAARGADEDPVQDDPIQDQALAEKEADPGATGGASFVHTTRATLNSDGTATAPSDAPQEVQDIIEAGNEIYDKPYIYGGGHNTKFKDKGYDCSGSVSYALHGADLLKSPLDSTSFESWGSSGPGTWVTIYANSGHAYMVVAGLRYDTSGAKSRSGSRWTDEMRPSDGYVVRHPPGL